jgi:glycosyltransferase involved in cell wall biosynthesis
MYALLYRFVLNLSDRVIVLTPGARVTLCRDFSVNPAKIVIIPNGISSPESARSRLIRTELGLTSDVHLVAMVGRLEPEKDWITFLKVAKTVSEMTKKKVAFLVVGSGSQEAYLREDVTKNRVVNVFFLGYRNDVPDILSDVDVFLLTSKTEAFGIALLEAMLCGCAIVATKSGGPDSILTDGVDGLLAEIGDVSGLSRHVVRLLENDALRVQLISNARETVGSYKPDKTSPLVFDLYRSVLAV